MVDNFKYYDDSLAHDFDMFMPKKKEEPAQVIKMPETAAAKKRRKSAAEHTVSVSVIRVLAAMFFVGALVAEIFLNLQIHQVNSKIVEINKEINQLDAEYTKLYVDMEKIVSYNNLESAAAALGMKKLDKNQVVYINVNDKNAAITSSGEKVVSDE
ncbi:MAG: cell division protein FtsL [Clostridiales bacterium]|nr:cell division protein FtsL [Candidatus Equinaster intestinalis]